MIKRKEREGKAENQINLIPGCHLPSLDLSLPPLSLFSSSRPPPPLQGPGGPSQALGLLPAFPAVALGARRLIAVIPSPGLRWRGLTGQ